MVAVWRSTSINPADGLSDPEFIAQEGEFSLLNTLLGATSTSGALENDPLSFLPGLPGPSS